MRNLNLIPRSRVGLVRVRARGLLGRVRRITEQGTYAPLIDAKAAGRLLGVPHTWLLAQAERDGSRTTASGITSASTSTTYASGSERRAPVPGSTRQVGHATDDRGARERGWARQPGVGPLACHEPN
jgi:hypothetical protein